MVRSCLDSCILFSRTGVTPQGQGIHSSSLFFLTVQHNHWNHHICPTAGKAFLAHRWSPGPHSLQVRILYKEQLLKVLSSSDISYKSVRQGPHIILLQPQEHSLTSASSRGHQGEDACTETRIQHFWLRFSN